MAMRYFFVQDEAQHGPYSATEMRGLASTGQIRPADTVWQEGTEQRFPAARVKNLFAAITVTEAPPVVVEAAAEPEPVPETVFTPAAEKARPKVSEKERLKRVISIKGGIVVGQDGRQVQFRKKCLTCNTEDQCRTTAVIRAGAMKIAYYCRKCRKGRTVEMMGTC
jgi:GYF domain 2